MKQLWLVRHAKSSWNHPELTDFERPLNDRGRKAAPDMGQRLQRAGVVLDRMITSPARRALETARLLAAELGYPREQLAIEPRIYEASPRTLLDILSHQPDECAALMLVGHNPGLQELSSRLAAEPLTHFPTCAVAAFRLPIKRWSELSGRQVVAFELDYPRRAQ